MMEKKLLSKKKVAVILSALTVVCASSVYASSPKVSGDVNILYEQVRPEIGSTSHNSEMTLRLNLEQPINEQWSAFARLGYRNFGQDNTADTIAKLDQYGFKYAKGEKTKLVLGVQEAGLGAFAGMVDLTDNIGDGMLAGVTMQTEHKDTTYQFLAGKFDKELFANNKRQSTFGFEIGKQYGDTNVAADYLHVDTGAAEDFYGVNVKHKVRENTEFLVEYIVSSANTGKNGIIYGVNYNPTAKDTLALSLRHLEANATPENIGGYDNDTKGVEISWERALPKNGKLILTHERTKGLSSGIKENITTVEYNISF